LLRRKRLLPAMVSLFQATFPPGLTRVRAALDAGNPIAAGRELHELSASTAAVGLRRLALRLATLGRRSSALRPPSPDDLDRLDDQFDAACRTLLDQR
jgi:hypothetical protein